MAQVQRDKQAGLWGGKHRFLTSDRREVDADQQSEKGGDVIDHVGHVDILGVIASSKGVQLPVFNQLS